MDFDLFDSGKKSLKKDWMDRKTFILGTVDNLASIIDRCIQSGRYACDLETSGVDDRVFVNGDGIPCTVDTIAGVGLSPDGETGYYIPLRHAKVSSVDGSRERYECNVPLDLFAREIKRLTDATEAGRTIAVFHNAKFDQEFMQFNGTGIPWGEWDKPSCWDDTMILCYLRNARARNKRLKDLSAQPSDMPKESWANAQCGGPGLGMEMIELYELFGHAKEKNGFDYDFTTLNPTSQEVLWYAASDVICTYLLYPLLSPTVLIEDTDGNTQKAIYTIEKSAMTAERWMERCCIHVDLNRVSELILLGHKEWWDAIQDVYKSATEILGRDVMPGLYIVLRDIIVLDDPHVLLPDQIDVAERQAKPMYGDKPSMIVGKDNAKFPATYDVSSPQQLGRMFEEMEVPGLKRTEKSDQVATGKEELERVIAEAGAQFPFMGKIKRFREVNKALSTYLYPMIRDIEPTGGIDPTGGLMRISFNGRKVDTGRYATPAKENGPRMVGWPKLNLQSVPSTAFDPKNPRPECMRRIREVVTARPSGSGKPKKYIAAVDFSGEELRLVTNLSGEPKWTTEFFHCSSCDRTFPRDPRSDTCKTPMPPPPRCPNCGSDKIGDLHTLTAMSIYGNDAPSRPEWKVLRGHAKGVNFGLCYGGGGQAVQFATGCDKNEGWRIKNAFDKTYTGLRAWWDMTHKFARKHGFVRTAFGRKYPLPDINHTDGFFKSKAERNAVNGPIQGCLHGDSRIPTDVGVRRIQDLVGEKFHVWTGTEWAEGTAFPSGPKDLVHTTLTSGGVLRTSPDHRFRVYDHDDPDRLAWVRQEDLTSDMWVVTDAVGASCPDVNLSFSDTRKSAPNRKGFEFEGNCEELWELLGLVIGDGSIDDDGLTIHVGGPDAETQAKFYLDRFSKAMPGLGITLHKSERGSYEHNKLPMWQVHFYNQAFRGFCTTLGVGDWNTYTKRIPEAVWHQSTKHRAAFLRGYFSADGCVNIAHAIDVRSVNRPLLQDTYGLLRSIGIRCVARLDSMRVGVKDIQGFQRLVGFLTPKKQDRLDNIPLNPWSGQWHALPSELITWVGNVVYGSTIYASLPREQKSAVLRLVRGSGSKPQCMRYLTQLPTNEVPESMWNLLLYDYEQVVSSDPTGTQVEMYDIEVATEEHAFVCDGVIVHNSGADIIKIAMSLIYRECKKRGWLEKCMMVATMHDELVFEIDADILEEALPLLVNTMASNNIILGRNWIIPLTCDVEIGDDWTVPWDINGMTYKEVRFLGNKKVKEPKKPAKDDQKYVKDPGAFQKDLADHPGKKAAWDAMPDTWPEELKPWFRSARGESTEAPLNSYVPSPMSDAPITATVVSVPSVNVGTEPPVSSRMVVANIAHLGMPEAPDNSNWEFKLDAPMTPDTIAKLARIIVKNRGRGMTPLKIRCADGSIMDLDHYLAQNGVKTPILVNRIAFEASALDHGLIR